MKQTPQSNTSMHRSGKKGFTLIDLMTTLAIIVVLASIAYPSYTKFILRSRRVDGLTLLLYDQILLERCYAQHFAYNICTSLPPFPHRSAQGFYTVTLTHLGTKTYTLTATPRESQTQDITCASMSVDQSNLQIAIDSSGTVQTTCWSST